MSKWQDFFSVNHIGHATRMSPTTIRLLIMILGLGLMSGCSWGPCGPTFDWPSRTSKTDYSASTSNEPKPRSFVIIMPPNVHRGNPEFIIIAIAQKYLITHEKWEGAEFERPMLKTEGGWSVLVRKVPKTPESTLMISFDETRQVTEIHSGL